MPRSCKAANAPASAAPIWKRSSKPGAISARQRATYPTFAMCCRNGNSRLLTKSGLCPELHFQSIQSFPFCRPRSPRVVGMFRMHDPLALIEGRFGHRNVQGFAWRSRFYFHHVAGTSRSIATTCHPEYSDGAGQIPSNPPLVFSEKMRLVGSCGPAGFASRVVLGALIAFRQPFGAHGTCP